VYYQHIFWFYSHPAVYVFVLPGLGVISEILPVFARKPLFGYRWVALSSMFIAIVGFLVWAHHMFTTNLGGTLNTLFSVTTALVAVPTGVKFFSWIATLWEGKISFEVPMLFVLGAFVVFLIGGLSGPPNAYYVADQPLHDTYWVVAHFHHTMFGGFIFPFIAAVYFWFPKATGKMFSKGWGQLQFWLIFIGFHMKTFPMFLIGLQGMRRRIVDYSEPGFGTYQLITTIGAYLIGISFLIFVYNMWISVRKGAPAPANPWGSRSIEWLTSSPPIDQNYARLPIVVGEPYDYGLPGAVYAQYSTAGAGDD
jgi:cytochrome c oxidase subunit 1